MRITVRELEERVLQLEAKAKWQTTGMLVTAISGLAALITAGLVYEQTRLATVQAELQASIVDTDLRVKVWRDPDERRPSLYVKVANHGAPVSVSGVALDLGDDRWTPRAARRIFERPVRLSRNDAIDFEITPTHAREIPRDLRGLVCGVVVELETGESERVTSAEVASFFDGL